MRVEDIEDQIGMTLPEDYRDFLASGVEVEIGMDRWYPITEPTPFGDSGGISRIFTLEDLEEDGLNGFPDEQMLFIGESSFGYPTCISLAPERWGHVFYYDYEQRALWDDGEFYERFPNLSEDVRAYLKLRASGQLPDKDESLISFYHCANSFTEFLQLVENALEDEDSDE